MQDALPRAPGDSDRHVIVGQTGTGKTGQGIFSLAWRSYPTMPWVMVDYKREAYIAAIGADKISPTGPIPTKPGLYHMPAFPVKGSIDEFLYRAHAQGNIGIYIDEGHCVGQFSDAFGLVLTQGRSLRIPMIILSQRPCWMHPFVFSEATFIQANGLTKRDDRKRLTEWLPDSVDINYAETLPQYHSLYFDVARRRLRQLGPVPYGASVLKIFEDRRPRQLRRVG